MTTWMHITHTAWATTVGIEAASDQIAEFFSGGEIQVVLRPGSSGLVMRS